MAEPELTLYAESTWMSPWVFHAMVALEEKALPYKLQVAQIPMAAEQKKELQDKAILGKVPVLIHGDLWISESLAISEYLAERFPFPTSPRLFPADLGERARARQLMSWLRTSMMPLREDRPTSSVFRRPVKTALSDKARSDATELLRIANALVKPGAKNLFAEWCIADTDFSLMLMRLIANDDPVPQHLIDYALAQWDRKSVKRYIAHLPTAP